MPRTRTLPLALTTLLAAGLALGVLAPAAEAQGGKHYQTVLRSHGLKAQACIGPDDVLYLQGDGRGTKKYFANLTYTLSRNGVVEGNGNFSVSAGIRAEAGGQTAAGALLTLKAKIYTTRKTHLVDRAKAKVDTTTLGPC